MDSYFIIFLVYVDDLILVGNSLFKIQHMKDALHNFKNQGSCYSQIILRIRGNTFETRYITVSKEIFHLSFTRLEIAWFKSCD